MTERRDMPRTEGNERLAALIQELSAELEATRARAERAEAERNILKKALSEIDHHEVGAYEVVWSNMPEPCEACVEMREIAERGLAEARQ